MRAKLGDTVLVHFPNQISISPDTAFYWDEYGRPTDANGKLKYLDDIKAFVLDTSEKVEAFNDGTFFSRFHHK